MMLGNLISSAVFNLCQLSDFLKRTGDEEYSTPLPVLFGSSVGMHVRHILEFYQCLIHGEINGGVNYDARIRDLRIERDLDFAQQVVTDCIRSMELIVENKELILFTSQDLSDRIIEIPTNTLRELTYLIEHSIHHIAMIKMAYAQHFPMVNLPENFGVAFSTIKYKQLVHSNVSSDQ